MFPPFHEGFLTMGIHRILHQMYEAACANYVLAAGQTITCTQWNEVFEVSTAGATDTLTLARPTKPGMLCAVVLNVDGGDLTLTVTGGYNRDADTSVTLADAGDAIWFYSIQVGTSFYWNAISQRGTNADIGANELTIDTMSRPAVITAEHGAGAVGVGGFCRTYRYTRDGIIITEIEIDMTGLGASGTTNDVIGVELAAPVAYLGRNVVATNGIIFKIEMTCLEVPATGDADVILVSGTDADEAFDLTVAGSVALCDGVGDWTLGETVVNITGVTADHYYYLTQGAADNADYTAGQFLIRFYGKAALSA